MRRMIVGLLALSLLPTAPVLAEDDDKWWFDVEVILFSRDTRISELDELFTPQAKLTAPDADWDLLSDYYQPDISWIYSSLPECNAPDSPLWVAPPTLEQILAEYVIVEDEAPDPVLEPAPEEAAQGNSATVASVPAPDAPQISAAVASPPLVTPPPSPTEIAQYWLESLFNKDAFTPFTPPAPALDCVAQRAPEFVTTGEHWHWQGPNLFIPPPQQTDLYVEGANWARASHAHLLPTTQLEQNDIFTSIRWRKGIDRLAHFAWRQQVDFGQDKAATLRLFAGKNYASQFTVNGELRQLETPANSSSAASPEVVLDSASKRSDGFFAQLNAQLQQPKAISFATLMSPPEEAPMQSDIPDSLLAPIWQLDGTIQVYLKYINRVPYLHINSELFYRQPVLTGTDATQDYELISIPFKQLRRVISTQLHYFDHPLFGMVVQIRRYERPSAPREDDPLG